MHLCFPEFSVRESRCILRFQVQRGHLVEVRSDVGILEKIEMNAPWMMMMMGMVCLKAKL